MSLQQIVNPASNKRIQFNRLASGSFSLIMCTFHTLRHIQKVHSFHLQWSSHWWLCCPLMFSSGLASSIFGFESRLNHSCWWVRFLDVVPWCQHKWRMPLMSIQFPLYIFRHFVIFWVFAIQPTVFCMRWVYISITIYPIKMTNGNSHLLLCLCSDMPQERKGEATNSFASMGYFSI